MKKAYEVIRIQIGVYDVTAAIQECAKAGWRVHTFTALPSTEDEASCAFVLLERDCED